MCAERVNKERRENEAAREKELSGKVFIVLSGLIYRKKKFVSQHHYRTHNLHFYD